MNLKKNNSIKEITFVCFDPENFEYYRKKINNENRK